MKGRTLVRHGREGMKNLGRNGWMTFASVSAVTIMLLVVGVFLLLILNMNHIASTIEEDVEIRAYIELTATPEQQQELRAEIENVANIDTVTFLHKDEGLDQLIDSLGEQGEVFESLRGENPLNDVFVIRAITPQHTEEVAEQLQALAYIERIDYGKGVVERLFAVTDLIRVAGLVLVVGLMFTAMFLIANTIKLTIVNRKEEIQIMKLVGATNGFIRWPFFIEGLLLGVLGAVVPIVLLYLGYSYIYEAFSQRMELVFFDLLPPQPFALQVAAILLLIAAFIGIWGSMMSVRKFLKV